MLIDKQQLKVEIEDGREVKSLVKIKTTLSSLSILRYRFKGFPYLESHSVWVSLYHDLTLYNGLTLYHGLTLYNGLTLYHGLTLYQGLTLYHG